MKKIHGFTLIELLVSMALLSMVVLAGSSAFGLFSQRWDGQLGKFDATMRNAKNLMLVQNVLDGLVPYVVYSSEGRPKLYFEGNRNGFVSVSSESLYSYGDLAVVRFSVKQNDDMSFDVLYEEWPMEHDILVSLSQEISFSSPLVLFSSVDDPLFEYYGWADFDVRRKENDGEQAIPPTWSQNYNAVKAGLSPLRARLVFSSNKGGYQISSVLMSQLPGLLSRYKFRPSNNSGRAGGSANYETENGVPLDDCEC